MIEIFIKIDKLICGKRRKLAAILHETISTSEKNIFVPLQTRNCHLLENRQRVSVSKYRPERKDQNANHISHKN